MEQHPQEDPERSRRRTEGEQFDAGQHRCMDAEHAERQADQIRAAEQVVARRDPSPREQYGGLQLLPYAVRHRAEAEGIPSMHQKHNPDEAKEENRQRVEIVALANAYANTLEIGSSGDPAPENPMVTDLVERVGVSWSALSDLSETVLDEIERARVFLQISKQG